MIIRKLNGPLDDSFDPSSSTGGGNTRKRKRLTLARNSWKEYTNAARLSFPGQAPSIDTCRTRLQQFENAVSLRSNDQSVCCVCGTIHHNIKSYSLQTLSQSSALLRIPQTYRHIPANAYYSPSIDTPMYGTILEREGLILDERNDILSGNVCFHCDGYLKQRKTPQLAYANEMWSRSTNLPEELADLTFLEWKLLSLSRPSVTVLRLVSQCHDFQSTQRGYKASCVSYPQPATKVLDVLPVLPNDVPDFLRVVFIGAGKPLKSRTSSLLGVRPAKIKAALEFLIKYNPLYSNVQVDQAALDMYDAVDIDALIIDNIDDVQDIDDLEHIGYADVHNNGLDNEFVVQPDGIEMDSNGLIDTNGAGQSHNESALNVLLALKGNHVAQQEPSIPNGGNGALHMPRSAQPHNEYEDVDFIARSYPELYPYGVGYPGSTTRPVMVSLQKHLQFALMHCSRSFSRHATFMFHVFNILQRRKSCFQAKLQTKRKDFTRVCEVLRNVGPADLEKALSMEERNYPLNIKLLLDKVYSIGVSIPGSQSYLRQRRREIQAMIIRYGPPHFYITLNPADIHSPLLLHLAGEKLDLNSLLFRSATYRSRILAANPVAQALFFDKTIKSIFQILFGFDSENHQGVLGNMQGFYGVYEAQGRGSLHIHSLVWLKERLHIPTLRVTIMDEIVQNKIIALLEHTVSQQLDSSNVRWDSPSTVSDHVKNNLNIDNAQFADTEDTSSTRYSFDTTKCIMH